MWWLIVTVTWSLEIALDALCPDRSPGFEDQWVNVGNSSSDVLLLHGIGREQVRNRKCVR